MCLMFFVYFITFRCMNNHNSITCTYFLHTMKWCTHSHLYTSARLPVKFMSVAVTTQSCTFLLIFATFDQPSVHMCVCLCLCLWYNGVVYTCCLLFGVWFDMEKNSLSPSIYETGHKTMTPSRIPVRSNSNKKSTPVQIEVSSSILTSLPSPPPSPTAISNDHISNNNDNKSKSTHPVSPLELQAIQ